MFFISNLFGILDEFIEIGLYTSAKIHVNTSVGLVHDLAPAQ